MNAYSLKTERIKEPDFPYDGQKISGTKELIKFVEKLQNSDIEKMIVIYLDTQNKLIGLLPIFGTINQAVIFPREVYKHALLWSASSLIIVHNHPSGQIKPSKDDIKLIERIVRIGKDMDIQVHDSLIIADKHWYSFREEGVMP